MPAREPLVLLAAVVALQIALGLAPKADRFTWFLENLPVFVVIPLLLATWRRFPLTPLAYRLIAVHAAILCIGGHWTYAEVPAGHWVREWLGLARNPYDRFAHVYQGFGPIILLREVLLRHGALARGKLAVATLLLAVLGISAGYELLEWQMVVWTGSAADDFLGTQGDVFDPQWDMACALIGGALALLLLARTHDRQLQALPPRA